MWIGSSTLLFIFKLNVRPSEAETRQPLVTFHSCFSSSDVDGSGVEGISSTPLGKLDCVGGALSGLLILGTRPLMGELEYSLLLLIAECGTVVGLAAFGVG